MLSNDQVSQFHDEGYVLIDRVLAAEDVALLIDALETIERTDEPGSGGYGWAGNRVTTIHTIPLQPGPLSRVVSYGPLVRIVEQLVGAPVRVTGGLLMDKDPNHNWGIGWHQDNGIYVDRIPHGEPNDVRGGLPVLSTKAMELARNVTCRLAIDPSTPENGGLYVLPRSHRTNLHGPDKPFDRFAGERGIAVRQAPGSLLCYAPLLLHRSEKSESPTSRRRVLHLQYGPADLALPGTNCYNFPQPVPLQACDTLRT